MKKLSPEVQDALRYVRHDFGYSADNFDFDEYRRQVRMCLSIPKQESWCSMGADHLVDKANMLEMINRSKVHIYIATHSSSLRYDTDIVTALKAANDRGVPIHVALKHWPKDTLPKVWQDIRPIATTFRTDVDDKHFVVLDEYLIGDNVLRFECESHIDDPETWDLTAYTETYSNLIDSIGLNIFGLKPKALTQALDAYDRQEQGIRFADTIAFVNRDCDNTDTFNLREYKRHLRYCFDEPGAQCWNSSGANGAIDEANIAEMLQRAEREIFIVARSDSTHFDTTDLSAAKERGVKINVALHKVTPELPVHWSCIKNIAHTFHAGVSATDLEAQCEHLIVDDMYRVEMRDTSDKTRRMAQTRTHCTDISPILNRFFYNLITPVKISDGNDAAFSIVWRTHDQHQKGN